MTTPPEPPADRRGQARLMRVINVPMRRVLGLPFPTPLASNLMLLYLTGRRTGRHYRQPVSYARHGDGLITPGGGNWKRNLVDGQPVRIRLRGHDFTALPELVGDIDKVEELLGVLASENPRSVGFIRIPRDSRGRWDRTALQQAVGYGFRIVIWHPADADAARLMGVPSGRLAGAR